MRHDPKIPAEPAFCEAMRWLIELPPMPELPRITVEVRKLDKDVWGEIEEPE